MKYLLAIAMLQLAVAAAACMGSDVDKAYVDAEDADLRTRNDSLEEAIDTLSVEVQPYPDLFDVLEWKVDGLEGREVENLNAFNSRMETHRQALSRYASTTNAIIDYLEGELEEANSRIAELETDISKLESDLEEALRYNPEYHNRLVQAICETTRSLRPPECHWNGERWQIPDLGPGGNPDGPIAGS